MATMSVTSGVSLAKTGVRWAAGRGRSRRPAPRTRRRRRRPARGWRRWGRRCWPRPPRPHRTRGCPPAASATSPNSSAVLPAIETSTRAPTDSSHGRSSAAKASMPGPCRPMELSMPDAVSAIRGVPRPERGSRITVLVTNAPSSETGKNRCSSRPLAAHPDAVITGLGSVTPARVVARSTISGPPPAVRRGRRPGPGRCRPRRRPSAPGRRGTPGPRRRSGPSG